MSSVEPEKFIALRIISQQHHTLKWNIDVSRCSLSSSVDEWNYLYRMIYLLLFLGRTEVSGSLSLLLTLYFFLLASIICDCLNAPVGNLFGWMVTFTFEVSRSGIILWNALLDSGGFWQFDFIDYDAAKQEYCRPGMTG